ncbi:hypothetical protein DWF04_022730 [Cereibacter sphaeroides f. sp. denitrificans]|nr:hypothetical protein DWF04_15405 [Cereibacter sphaeroides f. sp. denitrificans]
MAAAISYIGATIGCVASSPATDDAAGFGALTYSTIGKIASWGAVGDTSEDITIQLLDGRTEHVNGSKDGGAIPFTFRADAGDAGQTILLAQSNTNTEVSFKITDPDGKIAYFRGKVANVRDQERAAGNYKGYTGEVRVNSATIRV